MTDAKLAALLRQAGYSGHEAHMIADLSEHASLEAVQALTRVCDTAPKNLVLPTIMISAKLLKHSLDKFIENAEGMIALKATLDRVGKL
jgi:hypothetical protein